MNPQSLKKKICLVLIISIGLLLIPSLSVFKLLNIHVTNVQAKPILIACVGDSITEVTSYTNYLEHMLGTNYSIGNFGASGSTISLSTYKPYMLQPEFQDAKIFEPDVVVIMLGTNDAHLDMELSHDAFESDYALLIDSFQNLDSTPEVLIVKSPPVYNNNLGISPTLFSQNVIPSIIDVANSQSLEVVDVFDMFGNHSDYMIDGVHPNDAGAMLIASAVFDVIASEENSSLVTNGDSPDY
jgi:lysophospholipase L1-like esterase